MDLFEEEKKKYCRLKKKQYKVRLPISQIILLEKQKKVYGIDPSFFISKTLDIMLLKDKRFY